MPTEAFGQAVEANYYSTDGSPRTKDPAIRVTTVRIALVTARDIEFCERPIRAPSAED
jgi:hypothetical protein